MAYHNLTDLVGQTPIIKIRPASEHSAQIWAKIERFNPGGSVKDRIALAMLDAAENEGRIKPGSTIVEATSGNTGIGLAWAAAHRGYQLVLVMPESMSEERKALLKFLGAELYLTPGEEGMNGAVKLCRQLLSNHASWFMPNQFENPANPDCHLRSTGPELWKQTCGRLDVFVAGVGTGGTITGVGRYLKSLNPHIRIVAVEPAGSPVLSGGQAGPHKIQGIGAGFVPPLLDKSVLDEVITVSDKEAYQASLDLAASQGLFTGISSGAALHAARSIAAALPSGSRVVTLLPDLGDRYLSMAAYFRLDF